MARRFEADTLQQAIRLAPRKAEIVIPVSPTGMTIPQAFSKVKEKELHRKPRDLKRWENDAKRFVEWIARNHPGVVCWKDLELDMIYDYIDDILPGREYSMNHRRLTLQPIIKTSGFMSRRYKLPNICEGMVIGGKRPKETPIVYLDDVLDFCDWLKVHDQRAEIGAVLQGLVGLSVMEALRLTWSKVDLERGLIEISGETKQNYQAREDYRSRVIPVCDRALEVLNSAWQNRVLSDIEPVEGGVVVQSPEGKSYIQSEHSFYNYTRRRITANLIKFNPRLKWAPKDLRNCLDQFAEERGIWSAIWSQYMGRAARTVHEKNYVARLSSPSRGETTALNRKMQVFRNLVVGPINMAIVSKKKSMVVELDCVASG